MTPREFLEKLTGKWALTGVMLDKFELRQDVEAQFVLGGLFVEMRCVSTDNERPYEALYLIGYNEKEDAFVLNLFDTFGVTLEPKPGIGKLDGNAVEFVFDYGDPFVNRFEWNDRTDTWAHTLTSITSGEPKAFAAKHLSRVQD